VINQEPCGAGAPAREKAGANANSDLAIISC
jgi:hypothetical protein